MEKKQITQKDGIIIYAFGFLLMLVGGLCISLLRPNTNLYVYLSFLIPQAAYLTAIICYTSYARLDFKLDTANYAKKHSMKYIVALVLGAGVFFCGLLLNFFLKKLYVVLNFDMVVTIPVMRSGLDYFLSFLLICILPSVAEELLFRKTLIDAFSKLGATKAVLLSAVIFSLSHLNPVQTVYQFLLGIIYALIYIKTKNVILTIIAHTVNNGLAFFLTVLTNPLIWEQFRTLLWCFLIALPITILCLYLILKDGKVNTKKEENINIYTITLIAIMSVLWLIYALI